MGKHPQHPDVTKPATAHGIKPHKPTGPSSFLTSVLPGVLCCGLENVLKLLLPPACLLCGTKLSTRQCSPYLCPECASGCTKQPIAACPICAEPFQSKSAISHLCSQCTTSPAPFIWLKTIGLHADQLQYAVQRLKYAGQFQLAETLARLLIECLQPDISAFNPHTIIPVPLHPQRLRVRGFNQSLLIAHCLGAELDIRVDTKHLIRTKPTSSQTMLNLKQRHQNILGAFRIEAPLSPQRILLIDDVVTTTATCRECSKVLTKAGHRVAAVAISRASLQH